MLLMSYFSADDADADDFAFDADAADAIIYFRHADEDADVFDDAAALMIIDAAFSFIFAYFAMSFRCRRFRAPPAADGDDCCRRCADAYADIIDY